MAQHSWLEVAEYGSVLGIRFFFAVLRLFGRTTARFFLYPVIFYYAVVSPSTRAASRAYLQRIGLPTSFRHVYRHLLWFGQCTLDRFFLVRGDDSQFEMRRHGHEYLEDLRSSRTGALLLGAHLGSFEAMRMQGGQEALPINIVGNFSNARMINAELSRLNPALNVRLLEVTDGLSAIINAKECIERGELVAVLADRISSIDRSTQVDFLGKPAAFPSGAFMLAAALKCPVYLTFGLYKGGNRYDLYCEPFSEKIDLPRKSRESSLHQYVARYAERLEHYCRMAPQNWFNFYDFWGQA